MRFKMQSFAMRRHGNLRLEPLIKLFQLTASRMAGHMHEMGAVGDDFDALIDQPIDDAADRLLQHLQFGAVARRTQVEVVLLRKGGSRWQGRCDVTVADAFGAAVASATVSGHWTGAATDLFAVTTGSTGVGSDYSNSSSAPSGATFTCRVDSVSRSGWTYDATADRASSASATVPSGSLRASTFPP